VLSPSLGSNSKSSKQPEGNKYDSETSVKFYLTIWHHIPKDGVLQSSDFENIKISVYSKVN
jgi:hypothetical protein